METKHSKIGKFNEYEKYNLQKAFWEINIWYEGTFLLMSSLMYFRQGQYCQ